jgi:hypothetical protein
MWTELTLTHIFILDACLLLALVATIIAATVSRTWRNSPATAPPVEAASVLTAARRSTDEHKSVAPDLFTAETPLGTYQGLTDQVVLSKTPGSFRTVLVPGGLSKPEWLDKGVI